MSQRLIDELRKQPIQCLIVSIALPNVSRVALHESLRHTKAGQFFEVGYKFGEFVDVGYWELKLWNYLLFISENSGRLF
mgnify:CR=1 FL=1